jgi:hypothetical protein
VYVRNVTLKILIFLDIMDIQKKLLRSRGTCAGNIIIIIITIKNQNLKIIILVRVENNAQGRIPCSSQ